MFRITFLGAGSTVFAKNVLGDCMLTPSLGEFEIALYDIDAQRLEDSRLMLESIRKNYHCSATIRSYSDRKEALRGARFIVNAIQVGGYEPCTVTDFEVPKKYGFLQTIADSYGIGGIFRALRTFPVLEEFARDIHEVCPDALFLNYTNPMAMLTSYLTDVLHVNAIGLCHSVQSCLPSLLEWLKMPQNPAKCRTRFAGINHQTWMLEVYGENGEDLYPEIKRRAAESDCDKVRFEIMKRFGYYNTESSEHTAEYHPYFIKKNYPELISRFDIPIDEYPRRCIKQIAEWNTMRESLVNTEVTHTVSAEYAARIIHAVINDEPYRVYGNVPNTGIITNLPRKACVEVPCMIDRNGVNPCYVGDIPEQLAALNRKHVSVQILTVEAGKTRKKDAIYQAAYLDPRCASELSLDEIKSLCDDLIEAHGKWLPKFD
ncbi:MAG: alpha-glucosidase/alpha-galactosidase [Clostridia bacterium]|nr:alpha-glucosidase/alpha-galactosidase [Clostridia bacterium]